MAEIKYCKIVGDFGAYLGDGDDPDDLPDEVKLSGTIRFTPLIADGDVVLMPDHPDGPRSIVVKPVDAEIRGGRVHLNGEDHVMLLALDKHTNPSVMRYRVQFIGLTAGRDVAGEVVQVPVTVGAFHIEAEPDSVLDLTLVGRAPGTGSPGVIVGPPGPPGPPGEVVGGSVKPADGWLVTDLVQSVRDSLALADMAVQPDDARLSDARPPTAHQHVLDDLAVPVQASLAKADSAVQGDDARLTDSRTPKAHKHPLADLTTTGAAAGMVATVGAGGVAAWAAAEGGGATGIAVTGPYQAGAPNNAGPVVEPAVSKDSQVVIGSGASALNSGVVIGTGAKSTDPNGFSVAVGMGAEAGNDGTAVGRQAKANFKSSVAVGDRAAATKANQVMLGRPADTVTMPGDFEVGTGSVQVKLSTRLDAGKVQFGITWPGSTTFVPIAADGVSSPVADTGLRNIAASVTDGTVVAVQIRRIGPMVELVVADWKPATAGTIAGFIPEGTIPVGMRPPAARTLTPTIGASAAGRITLSTNGQATMYGAVAGTAVNVIGCWMTSDPWPTTLPGTPA